MLKELIIAGAIFIAIMFIPIIFLKKRLEKKDELRDVNIKEKMKQLIIFIIITAMYALITVFIVPKIFETNMNSLTPDAKFGQYRLDSFYSTFAVILQFIISTLWGILLANIMYRLTSYKDRLFIFITTILYGFIYYNNIIVITFSLIGIFSEYIYPSQLVEHMAGLSIYMPLISYVVSMIYFILRKIDK
jgi:hypothetical protein